MRDNAAVFGRALAAMLLTITVWGCTTGSHENAFEPTTIAELPGAPYTEAELISGLLTLADLPSGWVVHGPPRAATVTPTPTASGTPSPGIDCPFRDAVMELIERPTSVTASFWASMLGPYLDQAIIVVDHDDAERLMTAVDEAIQSPCVATEGDGGVTELKLSRLDMPKFGDQTVAATMEAPAKADEIPVYAFFVLSRYGDLVSAMTWSAIGMTPDRTALQSLAETADRCMKQMIAAHSERSTSATPLVTGALGGRTRDDAAPIGTTVTTFDSWAVSVVSVTPDATEAVLDANMLNAPPPPGRQFFIARVRASFIGAGSATFDGTFRLRALGTSGVSYSTFENRCGVLRDPLPDREVFLPEGTIEGNVCWSVLSSDVASLVMFDDPLQSSGSSDRRWWSLH